MAGKVFSAGLNLVRIVNCLYYMMIKFSIVFHLVQYPKGFVASIAINNSNGSIAIFVFFVFFLIILELACLVRFKEVCLRSVELTSELPVNGT